MKTIFHKIKKDALNNLILYASRNVNNENNVLFPFLFCEMSTICKIHRNRSPWLEVADIDNGMQLFTRGVIIFHCSILSFYPSEVRFVFFTQRYSKSFENASKIYIPIKS